MVDETGLPIEVSFPPLAAPLGENRSGPFESPKKSVHREPPARINLHVP